MLKGVNKVIIEVNDTGEKFFEKAIFYIRPEYANKSTAELEAKAKEYIESIQKPEKIGVFNYEDFDERIKKRRRLFFILGGYLVTLATVLFFIFY